MFTDNNLYIQQLSGIFLQSVPQISTIKPSEWTEKNVIMGKPRPGPFRYDYTPYAREPIDCLAPDHPARKVVVMKGSQIGFSSGVLIPGIGWMMQNNPGNTYLMVGAADLVEKAVEKLDLMIDGAGLRNLIKPQVKRRRSQKTGDTNEKKEFPGGYVFVGSANNHKAIAQVDLDNILLDDLDAMKGESKSSGGLLKLIEKRAAARKDTYKMFLVSTPLLKETSLIEPAYMLGDRRLWFMECPCCHEPIIYRWQVNEGETINPLKEDFANGNGGITWECNNHGQVIEKSVGYICYKCAGYFNDKDKQNMLNGGLYYPTATPSESGYFSYKIPSLYAPVGMFDWFKCVKDYVACNPPTGGRIEKDYQVFLNTVLGETYEGEIEETKATEIMHYRPYDPGIIPEKLSIKDGNGRIVLLTIGADLNGIVDDARLDYEIVAHSESGATYSIIHGSIGTFVPRENSLATKTDRIKWTYEHGKANSVWGEFDKIVRAAYRSDTGLYFKINMPCVDCGHLSDLIYPFIDWSIGRYPDNPMVGVRGHKEEKYIAFGNNLALYNVGKARNDIYYLQVGLFKDMLSSYMRLKWNEGQETQPANYMNFPMPSNGLYLYDNFFAHYESEHRVLVEDAKGGKLFRWVKKNSAVQNHMWDCRLYALAIREIIVSQLGKLITKGEEEKGFTWTDYVAYVTG